MGEENYKGVGLTSISVKALKSLVYFWPKNGKVKSWLKTYCICAHWKPVYYMLIRISCSFTKRGKIGNPSEQDLTIIRNHT